MSIIIIKISGVDDSEEAELHEDLKHLDMLQEWYTC